MSCPPSLVGLRLPLAANGTDEQSKRQHTHTKAISACTEFSVLKECLSSRFQPDQKMFLSSLSKHIATDEASHC